MISCIRTNGLSTWMRYISSTYTTIGCHSLAVNFIPSMSINLYFVTNNKTKMGKRWNCKRLSTDTIRHCVCICLYIAQYFFIFFYRWGTSIANAIYLCWWNNLINIILIRWKPIWKCCGNSCPMSTWVICTKSVDSGRNHLDLVFSSDELFRNGQF